MIDNYVDNTREAFQAYKNVQASFKRHTMRDKLCAYNTVLDLLSQIETTLNFPSNYPSRDLFYDQLYILECLVFREMKKIQSDLEGEYSGEKI
jgi:hypothetical protein